jgi:hypothetical protein
MPKSQIKTGMKYFLRGLSSFLAVIAGFSFLFGGRAISAFGKVDRLLAEILGIGVAFACLIAMAISKHVIDDIEWKEANEEEAAASASKMKP